MTNKPRDDFRLIKIPENCNLPPDQLAMFRSANLTIKAAGDIVGLLHQISPWFYRNARGIAPILRYGYLEDRMFSEIYRVAAWQYARHLETFPIILEDADTPTRANELLLRLNLMVKTSWRVRRCFLD